MTVISTDRYHDEWVAARKSGESYRSIGDRYGVSHERVRQVVGETPGEAGNIYARQRRARVQEIRDWLEAEGPVTRQALLARYGMNGRQFAYLIRDEDDFPMHLVILSARPTEELFSDAEMYAAMRRVWTAVKAERPQVPGLSHALYDKYRIVDEPSPARIIGREVTWEAACDHAGIPSGSTYRTKASYASVWSQDDLWDALIRYLEHSESIGIRPSYARYDAWQKTQQGLPSGTTVRLKMRTFGYPTWPGIVEEAVRRRSRGTKKAAKKKR